jgi:hypothetical protein
MMRCNAPYALYLGMADAYVDVGMSAYNHRLQPPLISNKMEDFGWLVLRLGVI